jgi:group I intron endonuclease
VHHSTALQRSWHRHGRAAFSWEILEVVEREEDLFPREQFWIDALGAFHPQTGANMYANARGPRGHSPSAEARAKMSAHKKLPRKPLSEEHKAIIGAKARGRKATAEARAKMSASRKGLVKSEAARRKLSATTKGVKKSPKHHAAFSAGQKRRARNEMNTLDLF